MENIISNKVIDNAVIYKNCSICKQDVDDRLFYKIRDTYKLAKCKECYKKMMNDRYTKKVIIKIIAPPDPNLKVNRQIKIVKDKLMKRFGIEVDTNIELNELKDIYNSHMKEIRRLKKNEGLRAKTILRKKQREEEKKKKVEELIPTLVIPTELIPTE